MKTLIHPTKRVIPLSPVSLYLFMEQDILNVYSMPDWYCFSIFFIKICLGEELKNQTINNYDIRNVQLMMSIINK